MKLGAIYPFPFFLLCKISDNGKHDGSDEVDKKIFDRVDQADVKISVDAEISSVYNCGSYALNVIGGRLHRRD